MCKCNKDKNISNNNEIFSQLGMCQSRFKHILLLSLIFVLPSISWAAQTDSLLFTTNNRIVIFKSGQEKFSDLFAAIQQAKKSIHLEYFNFRNDSISTELFSLLEQKVKDGVKVRAIFDGFGNASNNRPLRRKHLDSLLNRGIEIYEFDPLRFPYVNHIIPRDHRKIVVIDGVVAYTGGMNVADYYIKGKSEFGSWHDIHARVEGEAVGQLQKAFLDFWNIWTQQNVRGAEYYPGYRDATQEFSNLTPDTCSSAGKKRIAVVNQGPKSPKKPIHATFLQLINRATMQIQIINPYFTLCHHIRRALCQAIKRGVDVQVIVSAKSDIPITPRIVEHNAHRLMKKGVKVYFFEGGFHHSKIMMVDSVYSFIGSANLDSRSLSFDYECNLLIDDKPTTKVLQTIFNKDRDEKCWLLTPKTWKEKFKPSRRFAAWFWQWLTPFV